MLRLPLFAALLFTFASATAAQEPIQRPYGATPSDPAVLRSLPRSPDFRSYLPAAVDLSPYFPTPGDQGDSASCVGWAVGYAARAYLAATREGQPLEDEFIPSPGFLYNSNVAVLGDCYSGSANTYALDVLKERGALSLAEYPYDPDHCDPPTPEQVAAATEFRIADYRYVDYTRIDQVKGELASGNPVIIRIVPDEAFDALWNQPDGVWHSPPLPFDSFGHAMTLTGYDEASRTFRFINSWGADWSDGGYGRMDYQTFVNRTTEAFVMELPAGQPTIPVPVVEPVRPPAPPPAAPAPAPVPAGPVEADLGGIGCASVRIVMRGGQRVAEGFVNNAADLALAQEKLAAEADRFDIRLAPWPQCEALLTLETALAAADAPKITVSGTELGEGQTLAITVAAPPFDSYIHVAYVQVDGSVVHLTQADPAQPSPVAAGTVLKFGDGLEGRDRYAVMPPFGDEMLLVVASRTPLFPALRPQFETERDFLSALREAVNLRGASRVADAFVAAAYVPIRTGPR